MSRLSFEMQDIDEADIDMHLSRQAADRDLSGFDVTYGRYFPRIRHLISYRFKEDPSSEDITQEAFVRAYTAIGEGKFAYQGPRSLFSWLATIAVHQALDVKRRQNRISMMPVDFGEGYYDRPLPHDFTEDIVAADSATAMLAALSPERRDAIFAVDIEGEQYDEYADRAGVNLGTVRSRIHRGRKELRQNFVEQASAQS